MTTMTAAPTTLNRHLVTVLRDHLVANPDQHTEDEWALRVDATDQGLAPREWLSAAARACALAGMEFSWSRIGSDEVEPFWPSPDVTHTASLVFDTSVGQWVHVSEAARQLLGLTSEQALTLAGADSDEPLTTAQVVAILNDLLEGN